MNIHETIASNPNKKHNMNIEYLEKQHAPQPSNYETFILSLLRNDSSVGSFLPSFHAIFTVASITDCVVSAVPRHLLSPNNL